MKEDILTTRFFNKDDARVEKIIFPLPSYWWSRFYEYAWAAEFCNEADVVLDAGCGLAHPFKFYLAEMCKAVYAVDKDERILDVDAVAMEVKTIFKGVEFPIEQYNAVKFRQSCIGDMRFRKGMFDKIFCISVLEHLPDEEKLKVLEAFSKVLKGNGMVILTLDYPDTNIEAMEVLADKAGLKLAGGKNATIPDNAANWSNGQLYCFRMILIKKKNSE